MRFPAPSFRAPGKRDSHWAGALSGSLHLFLIKVAVPPTLRKLAPCSCTLGLLYDGFFNHLQHEAEGVASAPAHTFCGLACLPSCPSEAHPRGTSVGADLHLSVSRKPSPATSAS